MMQQQKTICACGCQTEFDLLDEKGRPRKYIHNHHQRGRHFPNKSRYREKNNRWVGGRTVDCRGYIRVLMPEHRRASSIGQVYEHIVVYEKYHKCCILSYAHVHHIDKNTKNNKIENLLLMSCNKHIGNHMTERWQKYRSEHQICQKQ